MSPLDSKIACRCQSIEINNNKHVYRQSQVRMPNGSGIEWAECSLIIGTGCRVKVSFSLILDSSVGLSAGIQSAGDSVPETLWVRILHSAEEDNLSPLDSEIACLCQSIEIYNHKQYFDQLNSKARGMRHVSTPTKLRHQEQDHFISPSSQNQSSCVSQLLECLGDWTNTTNVF